MPIDRATFLRVVNSSERLRGLLATSIQVGIRQILGYEMHLSEAKDLARVHTLSSAIDEIEERIHVHEGLQNTKRQTRLAIHETIITGSDKELTRDDLDAIVKGREVTIALQRDTSSASMTVSGILGLQREISAWAKAYRHFLRSVYRLYSLRFQQLEDLNLRTAQAREAAAEMDELFMDALERSHRLRFS